MLAERIGTEQGKHRSGPAPALGRRTGFAPGGGRIIRGLLRHGLTTAIVARTTAPQGPLFRAQSRKSVGPYVRASTICCRCSYARILSACNSLRSSSWIA